MMVAALLTGWEIVLIIAIVAILFGAKRLFMIIRPDLKLQSAEMQKLITFSLVVILALLSSAVLMSFWQSRL